MKILVYFCLCCLLLTAGCRDHKTTRRTTTAPSTQISAAPQSLPAQPPATNTWALANPGDSITIASGGEGRPRIITTERVLQVRPTELVIERTMQIGADKPTSRAESHNLGSYDPRGVAAIRRGAVKVATEQLTISGQIITADIYDAGDTASTAATGTGPIIRVYLSEQVPGQWVRAEEITGDKKIVLAEVTEFYSAKPQATSAPQTQTSPAEKDISR